MKETINNLKKELYEHVDRINEILQFFDVNNLEFTGRLYFNYKDEDDSRNGYGHLNEDITLKLKIDKITQVLYGRIIKNKKEKENV